MLYLLLIIGLLFIILLITHPEKSLLKKFENYTWTFKEKD